jgi:hypothetical protein
MLMASLSSQPGLAENGATVVVTLKNDTFVPAEFKVGAGKPFMLRVVNGDPAPAEIEAQDLKIEKVVAGNSEIVVSVRALEPGRYLLVNEYKEDTVKAFVVAE